MLPLQNIHPSLIPPYKTVFCRRNSFTMAYHRRLSRIIPLTTLLAALIVGCNNQPEQPKEAPAAASAWAMPKQVPVFDADSAYRHIERQVAMGPRVPGTPAQRKCADYMEAELKQYCDTVYKQDVKVKAGDGQLLPCINLIGVINPSATRRILLLTHWDSRPWADQDTINTDKPILAADDGGSGVGTLIELARQLKGAKLPANIGVDILLTDVEDYGNSEKWGEDSYCLGTQYWATHLHTPGYKADYGILLDMVGAKGATFPMEGYSSEVAGGVQQKVWQAGAHAGYSSFFAYVAGPPITDDHVPVNKLTGIKTIDIINMSFDPENPFAPHWHTHGDNMTVIDKATLKAVGQTLLQVIYEEQVNL